MNEKSHILSVNLSVITLVLLAMAVPDSAFAERATTEVAGTLAKETRITTSMVGGGNGSFPVNTEMANAENAKLPIDKFSYQPLDTPAKLNKYIRMLTKNIAADIETAQTGEVLRQAGYILRAADDLSSTNMEHPVACKFIVPSLCQSYVEAVRLLQEGARAKDRAKMRLGLEKLDNANRSETWAIINQAHGKPQSNQSKPAGNPRL